MFEFWDALTKNPFMQYALLAGLLTAVACGIVGTYVVVRRISYIADGVAHCVFGGLGAAWYLQKAHGLTWLDPLYGAAAAAILAALIIGIASLRGKQREDTVISALWAIGMAVGILFIAKTPGYNVDLMSYLFGNILMVPPRELWLIGGLDVVVLTLGLLFYNQFQAVCFDEEFARLRGVRVEFYFLLLLCLTALTVVLLVWVVGIVLVVALLTLPVAIAGVFSRTLWQMMGLSALFTVVFTTTGFAVSYGPDLPTGGTIVVLTGVVYAIVMIGRGLLARRRSRA